jgi:glycosyltransferase involved in cell wall biosynthesis
MSCDVSVIISHYNKAKFLEHAIWSAKNQTIPPKEIIVVDDFSCTKQRNRAFKMCRNHVVTWVPRISNGGPSKARNDGIRVSTGEWIQIVDADDYLTRDSLEVRLKVLSTSSDALWIAGYYAKAPWFISPKTLNSPLFKFFSSLMLRPKNVTEPDRVLTDDPWKVKWPHVTILFHRSLFEKYGLYDESVLLGQDKEIRWRFWYFSQTVPVPVRRIVYIYRRGIRGQLTSPANSRQRAKSRTIMMANLKMREKYGLKSENTEFL